MPARLKTPKQNDTDKPLANYAVSLARDRIMGQVSTIETLSSSGALDRYKNDPVAFFEEELNEVVTDDIKTLCEKIRDNQYVIARSANGTGKTHAAARIAVWFYKCYENVKVYTAAAPPEDNLRRLLWGEIGKVVAKNPALFVNDEVKLSSLHIARSKNSDEFITGLTIPQTGDPAAKKARFSGKHAPNMLFIIDEGDAIPNEIYEAIESCMSGGNSHLLILFNPRAASGPVFQMERLRQAVIVELSAFNHPNVVTGQNLMPGAVDRETTVRRINDWTRPLMDGELVGGDVFSVPSFLVNYKAKRRAEDESGDEYYPPLKPGIRKIVEPVFAYMVLGKYSSQAENQLIARDACERAVVRMKQYVAKHGMTPPSGRAPRMGLDVAELGVDLNVETLRYEDFVSPQKQWGGIDVLATARKAAVDYILMQCEGAFVDSNGLGSAVPVAMMEADDEIEAYRILVQESPTEKAELDGVILGQFDRIRDQGWWAMSLWMKTERVMLPEDALRPGGLVDQMCAATYDRTKVGGRIKVCSNEILKEKLKGRSPDHATSLMLTHCPIPEEEGAGAYHGSNYLANA